MKTLVNLLLLCCSIISATAQEWYYFPERNGEWEEKLPEDFKLNSNSFTKVINFAEANEYSGSRDLRMAILKGFEREPFHQILGPTKKRGGPAGIILKKDISSPNGEIQSELI